MEPQQQPHPQQPKTQNLPSTPPPEPKSFAPGDLQLYVYGSRESDQFWLPEGNSQTRRPFCLTAVEEFSFDDEDPDVQPIPNPLFKASIFQIACGGLHSIVLTTDGRVFTMGCNDEGALGRKGVQCIPGIVDLEDPIDMIAAGDNHSLFVNSVNGAIYFSGNYNYKRGEKMTESIFVPVRTYASEINISNKNKRIQKIGCGANHSVILVNNKVYCRGEPEASTTGRRVSARHTVQNSLTFNGVNINHVEDIVCGGYHTIAKCRKSGKVSYYAWGTNTMGQLGIKSFENQPYPVEIKKMRGVEVDCMAAGAYFTLFLTSKGQVFGCGCNDDCNLGLGSEYVYESSNDQEEQESEMKVEKKGESEENAGGNNQKEEKSEKQPEEEKKPQNAVGKESNLYIKSLKKINLPEGIKGISCGQNFSFAWSKTNLFSWGFGMSYVLLNGSEEQEDKPFPVREKIIHGHRIHDIQAGGQHVMYLSYPPHIIQESVKVQANPNVWENLTTAKRSKRR